MHINSPRGSPASGYLPGCQGLESGAGLKIIINHQGTSRVAGLITASTEFKLIDVLINDTLQLFSVLSIGTRTATIIIIG